MIDLINNAQGGGAKILDAGTGNLVKKVPCGFYPNCANTLEKDSIVTGGVVIQPPDHKRIDKLVYLCGEHKEDEVKEKEVVVDIQGDIDERQTIGSDEEDRECSLDELESSVSEEQQGLGAVLGMEMREGGGSKVELDEAVNEDDDEDPVEDEFMSQSLLKRPL